ncbi:Protein HGH1 [Chionoecetes opilio]|uniref:Protein HGH1 n=1 Tax=Chionoecetes opilio TaxID=41210 RepID=A0A8J5CX17_CHIOP|nr:Protein HGH1 [Chionoecetes opilio]
MSVPLSIQDELVQFLSCEGRTDIKGAACMTASQLTGTPEGLQLLSSRPDALVALLRLTRDLENSLAANALRTLVNVSAEEVGAAALLALEEPEVVGEMMKYRLRPSCMLPNSSPSQYRLRPSCMLPNSSPSLYRLRPSCRLAQLIAFTVQTETQLYAAQLIAFTCIEDRDCANGDLACGVLANLSKPRALCQKVLERVNACPAKLEGLTRILCLMDHNKKGAKLHSLASVITNFSQLEDGRR